MFKFTTVCIVLLAPSMLFAQGEELKELPPAPTIEIRPRESQVKYVEATTEDFAAVTKRLRDNYEAAKQKLQGLPPNKKDDSIARLNRIVDELKRLNKKMEEYANAVNNDKPTPSFTEGADPKAYTNEEGDPDKELVGQLLQLAAAGVCVYAPPYCPVALAIAQMLGLNLNEVQDATKVMDAVNRHAAGQPLSREELELIGDATGLSADVVTALNDFRPTPTRPVPPALKAALSEVVREQQIRSARNALGNKGEQLVRLLYDNVSAQDAFTRTYGTAFDSVELKKRVIAQLNKVYAENQKEYIEYANGMDPK